MGCGISATEYRNESVKKNAVFGKGGRRKMHDLSM
jgi:hypothetical protein